MLVFSHGFAGNSLFRIEVLKRLVRDGFVIAAPTFPLTRVDAPGGPTNIDYVNQPGDVSFVITRVHGNRSTSHPSATSSSYLTQSLSNS